MCSQLQEGFQPDCLCRYLPCSTVQFSEKCIVTGTSSTRLFLAVQGRTSITFSHVMKAKGLLLLAACLLPNVIADQGKPPPPEQLTVSEMRRVMPDDSEGESAKDHFTQIKVGGLTNITGQSTFSLQLFSDLTVVNYDKTVNLTGVDEIDITFDGPMVEAQNEQLLVVLTEGSIFPAGMWNAHFNVTDLEARVATIAGDYVRVTAGNLISVSDTKVTCDQSDSPCYFKKDELAQNPPNFERCKTFQDEDNELYYCDDTVSGFIPLKDDPSFLLLDNENLNLRYENINATIASVEVLVIGAIGNITTEDTNCIIDTNSPMDDGCSMDVILSKDDTDLMFTVIYFDDEGYVEGSDVYPFEIFDMDHIRLTGDAIMTTWASAKPNEFDVSVATKENLYHHIFEGSLGCGGTGLEAVVCEYFFIELRDIEKNYVAIVDDGHNAIAITVTIEKEKKSTVSRISRVEGSQIQTEFTVDDSSTSEEVKLVEVITTGINISNVIIDGILTVITDARYVFKATDDLVSFEEERYFLLVEYDQDSAVQQVGAAYVTFEENDVYLVWVADTPILRERVNEAKTITINDEPCNDTSPCYIEGFDGNTEFVQLCTLIGNSASGTNVDQCLDTETSKSKGLEENPFILILDGSDLILRYKETYPHVEVLMLDGTKKTWISKDEGVDCTETNNTIGCSMYIGSTEGLENVIFAIVSTDEYGNVTGSSSFDFEIFKVEGQRIIADAVMAKWSPSTENTFDVSIKTQDNLDVPLYKMDNITCGGDASCESFFLQVNDPGTEYLAVVQTGNNAIATSINEVPPESATIIRISGFIDPVPTTNFYFESSSKPASVKMVEVVTTEKDVFNDFYTGEVIDVPDHGYQFKYADEDFKLEGTRKFLLVEYNEIETAGDIIGASAAYVTFEEYDVKLDWIDSKSLLREMVQDDKTISFGGEECTSSKSPCYFTSLLETENVQLCIKIKNVIPESTDIDQCKDHTPVLAEGLDKKPVIILLDDSNLNLRYEEDYKKVEVLVLDAEGGAWISKNISVDCALNPIASKYGCKMDIEDSAEGQEHVTFVVVSVEANVVKGSAYLFETFAMNTTRLTADAVMAYWLPKEGNTYNVTITTEEDIDNYEYIFEIDCGGEGTAEAQEGSEGQAGQAGQVGTPIVCQSFFVSLDDAENYIAVVKEGQHAIANTLSTVIEPEQSTVQEIEYDEQKTKSFFHVDVKTKPQSVEMVEVTIGKDKIVTNIPYSGDVIDINTGYKFVVDGDVETPGTEQKLLLVGYNGIEDGFLEYASSAGGVYVTFNELDAELNWMSNSSSILREYVNDDSAEYTIAGTSCAKTNSPCYITSDVAPSDTVPVCTPLDNGASKGTTVKQCGQREAVYSPVMSLDKVQVVEGNFSSIAVTSPELKESCNAKVMLFSNNKPLLETEQSCDLENNTCIINDVHLPDAASAMSVFVMCTEGTGVTKATVADVDHLKFITQKIAVDALLVRWTAIKADDYVAELFTDDAEELLPSKIEVSDYSSFDIICDLENSCYATFLNLDPLKHYHLSVHKKGDEISETSEDIGTIGDLPTPEAEKINVTKVSRVNNTTTKISVSEEVTSKVQIFVGFLDEEEQHVQVAGKGSKVDQSNKIFSFTHTVPIFGSPKKASFEVIAYEDTNLLKTAIANLDLQALDAKLAWVGNKRGTDGSSLRVDTGSQDDVIVGSKHCLKKNSPCYYIEDFDLPEVLENCVKDSTNIYQCNEEVTQFKKLNGVEITINGDDMVVTAPLSQNDAELEVKIYSPSNTSVIYSVGNATCTPETEEKGITIECQQALQVPNGVGIVKVIVSEVARDGSVIKSAVSEEPFTRPSEGTEPWIIAVSVLGSIFVVALIGFAAAITLKKKKSRKWQSRTVEKELDTISEISRGGVSNKDVSYSPNYPEKRLSHYDEQPKLERQHSHFDEKPKPERQLSRYDDQPRHNRKDSDSSQMSVKRSKNFPSPYTKAFPAPGSSGYDNKGYSPSLYSEGGIPALPRINIGASKPASSNLHKRTEL